MPAWDYDIVIVGAGPAGLTAGIYAGRARLKTLLLEKLIHGGQVMTTDLVENYPGFPEGISGFELSDRMRKQAERFGLEFRSGEVLDLEPGPDGHLLRLEGEELRSGAVIIASGARYRSLGVPGEKEFTGKGVSFCATCDGALYRGETIAVVGGGDTALTDSLFLCRFAEKIHLIHRRNAFRGVKFLQEQIFAQEKKGKVEIHWDTVVQEIQGQQAVEAVELKNVKTGELSRLPVAGVFIFVGITPNTAWLQGRVPVDEWGFVLTNADMATSIPGIFAAGDVRSKLLRQIATAVGDGAIAAFAAGEYLAEHHPR
ncbi:MAG: thioredoxin-disulfide reductase [Deltaproteobacteria bacterium]|nr:thioredoxin-disulfide reductase [Deltaproteobacteria bacterium]MBI4796319.1 thioredoxin-disulfide reductase [Deltaproteobacteria bacterium]